MITADEKLATILQKVEWAKKHLRELEIARNRFLADDAYEAETYDDPQTGDHVSKMLYVNPVSVDVSLIIGDVLHNARTALDHLAYSLAPSPDTYFPIFSNASKCRTMDTRHVKALSKDAKKRIREI